MHYKSPMHVRNSNIYGALGPESPTIGKLRNIGPPVNRITAIAMSAHHDDETITNSLPGG